MKISVLSGKWAFSIPFPTRLLCSSTAAHFANHMVSRSIPEIPPSAMKAFYREIKRMKRRNPDWCLVEVLSADGDIVRIKL